MKLIRVDQALSERVRVGECDAGDQRVPRTAPYPSKNYALILKSSFPKPIPLYLLTSSPHNRNKTRTQRCSLMRGQEIET